VLGAFSIGVLTVGNDGVVIVTGGGVGVVTGGEGTCTCGTSTVVTPGTSTRGVGEDSTVIPPAWMLTDGNSSPSSAPLAAGLAESARTVPSESAIAGAVNRCLEDGPMLVARPPERRRIV
jgi:hypothetical protein